MTTNVISNTPPNVIQSNVGRKPVQSPLLLANVFYWDTTGNQFYDLSLAQLSNRLDFVQSVLIDNTNNASDIMIYASGTGERIPVAAGWCWRGPVDMSNPPAITIVSATGAGQFTIVDFMNYPTPIEAWPGKTLTGSGGGSATAANQTLQLTQETTTATSTAALAALIASGALAVSTPIPASIVVGQGKVAVTGTAIQLASHALSNGIVVKALSTNAAAITVGGSTVTNTADGTGNGYILKPGEAVSFAVNNSNVLYFNGTAGDIISFNGN